MLNLIIFGPPGAGKGTQAALIAKKYKLTHLSSGDILRQELANGRLGAKIKKYQAAGELVPDSLIIKIMENAIAEKITSAGFLFDGYPRNIKQAQSLDRFLARKKSPINSVLNLRLSEELATKRIILRGRTSGRSDDNRQTLKNRFAVYRKQTAPLLTYYKKQKKVLTIDGRPNIDTVLKNIKKILVSLSSAVR